MSNKTYLSFDEIKGLTQSILRDIQLDGHEFSYVVGITRGGLVPATLISQYLEVPLLTLNWSLRDSGTTDTSELDKIISVIEAGNEILIVDDICDGGSTFDQIISYIKQRNPNLVESITTASLIHNVSNTAGFESDFIGREINRMEDDSWIVFPWESWWTN